MTNRIFFMLMLALTLGIPQATMAQKHRHTPQQQELVDSTSKGGVEVFSDTTSTAAASTPATAPDNWPQDDDDAVDDVISQAFKSLDGDATVAMLFILAMLFIIFVLAPVLIIAALFYFIYKNRRQKMKLAQMAMQQGQPIPQQLLDDQANDVTDEYQKGLRQCFVGVGLMIFLYYAAGTVGLGIGALVFCIGLGKVVAAKTVRSRDTTHNEHFADSDERYADSDERYANQNDRFAGNNECGRADV